MRAGSVAANFARDITLIEDGEIISQLTCAPKASHYTTCREKTTQCKQAQAYAYLVKNLNSIYTMMRFELEMWWKVQ